MGIFDTVKRQTRKARGQSVEPLGTGEGVYGAGDITETGGKSYKEISTKLIREKRKDDLKKGATKVLGGLQKMGQKMADAQATQEGAYEPIQLNSRGNGHGMDSTHMGLGLTPEPKKPQQKTKTAPKKKGIEIKLERGEKITITK